jgi:hypothetical protein
LSKGIRTNTLIIIRLTVKMKIFLIGVAIFIISVVDLSSHVLGQLTSSSSKNESVVNQTDKVAGCILDKAVRINGTWVVQTGLDCNEDFPYVQNQSKDNN